MPLSLSLPAVPLLIALNAFFVAAEYALVATRAPQLDALRRAGRHQAAAAMARLKEDPASAIGAIQICITMTNLLLGWIGEPAMGEVLKKLFSPLVGAVPGALFTALSLGLSFIIVTLLTVVFSELLPKALTLRYVPNVASVTAVPVVWILRATRPVVWLMNGMANLVTRPLGLGRVDDMEKEWHTAEEIRLIASEAADHGALTPRERSLILNSLTFGRRQARQVMVPRVRVAYLDLRRSMDENRAVMNERLYSRLPLCDGGMDRVIGVVHTKEFLSAYHAEGDSSVLQLIARRPAFEPETIPLEKLLAVFHAEKSEMVFLVDEYGGVEGIVTLQDVVDELVGHVREAAGSSRAGRASLGEGASAGEGVPTGEGGFSKPARAGGDGSATYSRYTGVDGADGIAGETPLHELALRLGRADWGGPPASVVTVGGLVVARLGRIPGPGEEVEVDGVRLHVTESDGRRVGRIQILPAHQ